MKRIVCRLPNASNLINGIAFEEIKGGGVRSEPVDDVVAAMFVTINGYTIEETEELPRKRLRTENPRQQP